MINKFLKMLDIPFDEEEYEKSVIRKSDAIRDCLCKNKNISGAFNDLSDKDQQNVVDAFNKMQSVFDGLFGVRMRPYTADDFKGATVKVQTSGTVNDSAAQNKCSECDKTCECENCDKKESSKQKSKYDTLKETFGKHANTVANSVKENAQKIYDKIVEKDETAESETSTICEDLLDELQSPSDFEIAAKDITDRVVYVLKDKKNTKYTLTPETSTYSPTVRLDILLCDVTWSSDKILEIVKNVKNWEDGPLEDNIIAAIKKATGAPNAYITNNRSGVLNVTIVLKNKNKD